MRAWFPLPIAAAVAVLCGGCVEPPATLHIDRRGNEMSFAATSAAPNPGYLSRAEVYRGAASSALSNDPLADELDGLQLVQQVAIPAQGRIVVDDVRFVLSAEGHLPGAKHYLVVYSHPHERPGAEEIEIAGEIPAKDGRVVY